jgi:hypothetical protein
MLFHYHIQIYKMHIIMFAYQCIAFTVRPRNSVVTGLNRLVFTGLKIEKYI